MRFMSFVMTLVLAGSALAQEKPVSAIPFAQILACVEAANCKNMTAAPISAWSDAIGFRGMVFDDAGWKYELYITGRTRDDLSIQMMAPGETRSSHLLTLDKNGVLAQAELRIDGGGASRQQMTDELLAARQLARKAYVVAPRWPRGGTLGEEFKPFWQKLADQALEAATRTLTRVAAPATSIADIIACARAQSCRGMQPSRLVWFDMAGIPVIAFSDGDERFAIRAAADLNVWITPKGSTRPAMRVELGTDGKVVSGELSPQPGWGVPHIMTTAGEGEQWSQAHKAFAVVTAHGEEFRAFWQAEADKALAAIRRTMVRAPAQEKPALSIADIRACAEKVSCANMKRSSVNWYDQVGIPVVEFSEDGYRYALRNNARAGDLAIWITMKGESRASRLLSVSNEGKVVSAELFAVPPGGSWPRRLTPEEQAKWYKDAKILSPATEMRAAVGEEYRPFWQELADQAVAAIRRTISK